MLNRVIKYSFAIVGATTGFTVTNLILIYSGTGLYEVYKIMLYIAAIVFFAVVFYLSGNKIIESITRLAEKAESIIQSMTFQDLTARSAGLITGLIVANLLTIPINKLAIINVPLAIIINILFASLGIVIAGSKKDDFTFWKSGSRSSHDLPAKVQPKLLDTNIIIDGRILDICRSGFLDGQLIIPLFVLEELRHIADSADSIKRSKGRRGLDILNILQNEYKDKIKITEFDVNADIEVDEKLIKAALQVNARIMTIDFNLSKIASLHGVKVLNINELSNAVKPMALPGEEMNVQVIKDGKENNQGIGYMNDGTMVVVEGGKRHIGETIPVAVTSVLQTAAGRMIFARPRELERTQSAN